MSYKIEPVTTEDEAIFFSVKNRLSNGYHVTEEEKRITLNVAEYWQKLDLDYILVKMELEPYFTQEAFDHLYERYYRELSKNGLSQGSIRVILADILYNGDDDILKNCIPVEGF